MKCVFSQQLTRILKLNVAFLSSNENCLNWCKALVLGISGGVDSTTCGRLAQLAVNQLNAESGTNAYQFIAVRLPYGEQKDEDEAQLALFYPANPFRFRQHQTGR